MEKICGPHPGANKTNSGSLPSSDRGNSSRKIGRTGCHSPGSASLGSPAGGGGGPGGGLGGSRGGVLGNSMNMQLAKRRQFEGVLCKYTNLIQGWQNRYFVLDPELGQLQYFVNEQGRSQKPRGSLPMIGASVTPSDEAPHMFIVNSVNGELYKLRAADAKEQQFWMNQLQACARRHSDSSAKGRKLKGSDEHLSVERTGGSQEALASSSSSRTRSFSVLPHIPPSSSPVTQRHLGPPGPPGPPCNIVTITHHKSPAAARRAKNQYPGRLAEVKEVMSQVEGQQKTLVQTIEALPPRGPLSCLDQDLLLLKATSAATLGCLGECLNILQQTQPQPQPQTQPQTQPQPQPSLSRCPPSGESPLGPSVLVLARPPSPPPPSAGPGADQDKGHTAGLDCGDLDCGPCPYLTGGALNLNVCNTCC